MSANTTTNHSTPYGVRRRDQLLGAFQGELEPVQVGPTYKLALFCAAAAMLLPPLVYLGLIGAVSYATYWHAVENVSIFHHTGTRTAVFLYGAPCWSA